MLAYSCVLIVRIMILYIFLLLVSVTGLRNVLVAYIVALLDIQSIIN